MRNRTTTALVATGAAAMLALVGCSSGGGGDQSDQSNQSGSAGESTGDLSGSIEVFANMPTGSPQEGIMQDVAAAFEEETGVTVELTFASTSFEEDMKVKMASDSVPDVFSTHGWSVLRYSPFLTTLDDRPWAQYVNPGLENVMYDDEGHIYALPLEYGTTGLLVNYDVLEEAGVTDIASLSTWEGFDDALAKVKAAGKIPMTAAGTASSGDIANMIASG